MKTIIAGSRTITNYEFFKKIMDQCPWKSEITEVVTGKCKGVDTLGERWADEKGLPKKPFPADWNKFGDAAGPIRNEEMAKYADAAIIIHREGSRGTQNMKDLADQYGLKVYYVPVRPKENFSLSDLKELSKQLENVEMVGGDLVRRILKQYEKQLQEYQTIVRDTRIMWEALNSMGSYELNNRTVYRIDETLVQKALETPTAKFLESLNESNKQDS